VEWDDEVDVVCTGAGPAGLASAIAAVDMGGEVFVASAHGDSVPSRPAVHSRLDHSIPWLDVDISDAQTNEYFAALSSDLAGVGPSAFDANVPIRAARDLTPVEPRGTIPPFIGARLPDWTARCLASPSGYLYTRVSDWQSTPFCTPDGDTIEVIQIGSITPVPDNVADSVFEWLAAAARDRWIDANPDCLLERIVFEEGVVVGAVFTTPAGPLAIRARHGVHIAADYRPQDRPARQQLAVDEGPLGVCLVGRAGSRFGRVELFSPESLTHGAPTCRPSTRALHTSLHEARAPLQTWRCGKLDGDTTLGQ
jgi:hypothetical protein